MTGMPITYRGGEERMPPSRTSVYHNTAMREREGEDFEREGTSGTCSK